MSESGPYTTPNPTDLSASPVYPRASFARKARRAFCAIIITVNRKLLSAHHGPSNYRRAVPALTSGRAIRPSRFEKAILRSRETQFSPGMRRH